MDELLNKAEDLFATLPRDTVTSVDTNITAAVFAGTRVKRRAVNNESDKHNAGKSKQLCWYHRQFADKSRFCNGLPTPAVIRAYVKVVEQRSRETRRAIRNWRRVWFARIKEKAAPLRSVLFDRLWLCRICSTSNKRGKAKPQFYRV